LATSTAGVVLKQIRTLFREGAVADLEDRLLLDRFVTRRDAAGAAFEALVARHGPMVRAVCRRVLGDPHAADDAAQATFLVLARKAATIRRRDSLAGWLFGVAFRVSVRARVGEARRRRHEQRFAAMAVRAWDEGDARLQSWEELYQELDRLPEAYRTPLVLCYLEGLTNEQAARRLRCPVRTVQRRLAQGRERLRARLVRRGMAPTIGLLSTGLPSRAATATTPGPWAEATTRAALSLATGRAATVPAAVSALMQGALRALWIAGLRDAAALLVALTLALGAGAAVSRRLAPAGGPDLGPASLVARAESPARQPGASPGRASARGFEAGAGYVLMARPHPLLRPLRPTPWGFFLGDSRPDAVVLGEVERAEDGALRLLLVYPDGPSGPHLDYRPVVFDASRQRYLPEPERGASLVVEASPRAALRRYRLRPELLPADRAAFVGVERLVEPANASSRGGYAGLGDAPRRPSGAAPRQATAEGFAAASGGSWAIEPIPVGDVGWDGPVAGIGGRVVGDVIRAEGGALHIRVVFAHRERIIPGWVPEYRPVAFDARRRRLPLPESLIRTGGGFPLAAAGVDGVRLHSRCYRVEIPDPRAYSLLDPQAYRFLMAIADPIPVATDVAYVGVERLAPEARRVAGDGGADADPPTRTSQPGRRGSQPSPLRPDSSGADPRAP
jgi:RNA polymerase sigma factor (sigma-70 family)